MHSRTKLYLALALGISSFPAYSAVLAPGQSATVQPGDTPEQWILDGATLELLPGAESQTIWLDNSSTLTANGGTITADLDSALDVRRGSTATLRNMAISGRRGIQTFGGNVSLVASTVSGNDWGMNVSGQTTARISASTLTNTQAATPSLPYAALFFGGQGDVVVSDGSRIIGAGNGIGMLWQAAGGNDYIGRGSLVVDGSYIESGSGAAIAVDQTLFASDAFGVDITLRNGSTVSAGNGNLLEVAGPVDVQLTVDASDIAGSVVNSSSSLANVSLVNGARLTGAMTNVTSANLSRAEWVMTADSTVGALNLGDGTITFQTPSTGSFSTLTVAGNYTGNGGTIQLNSALAGDSSPTNKLIVGGDTSGQTNIRVTNVGGAGAQTTTGVEVVSVAGASNGQFDLQGRAIGGQYEYFLVKDGSNWYLRSQSTAPVDPCQANPSLPECGGTTPPVDPVTPPVVPPVVPILRPEPGAYLANLAAAQGMFSLGYHDRHAGQNSGRAWTRVDGSRNGFAAMSRQLDITGNSQALTVGADLWRADNGSNAGVMLSSGNATSTSKSDLTRYYARGKVKGEALGLYGTLRYGNSADPYAGLYIDGSVQRAQFRNRVEGLALDAERYDTRTWQGAVEAGYAFRLATGDSSSIYLEPQLQVGYSRWDSYRHTESNGTAVAANNADGMFGRVGMRLSGVTQWNGSAAQVQPFLAVNWLHNRSEAEITMDGEAVDARIPRTRGEVSAGASVKFANRVGLWGNVSRQQGSGYHQTAARIGVSYDW